MRVASLWHSTDTGIRRYGRDPVPPPVVSAPGALAGADLTASYPLPTSNYAVWDPTRGNDANPATLAAPAKTLATALAKIAAGGTIVVRGGTHSGTAVGYKIAGTYTASLGYGGINVSKQCTIQPYPGEQVIFDGTRDETGNWVPDSGGWSKSVSITIDRGATDSYGKLDNDARGIGWLWTRNAQWRTLMLNGGYTDPAAQAFPLASWNEQVWIDDVKQEQVGSLAELTDGTFYIDGTTSGTNGVLFTSGTYYLGTDPTGKTVRIGELNTSLRLSVAGSKVRGITFRRFCGSNHMGGVLKATAANATFENVVLEHASGQGFELYQATGTVLRKCDVNYAGNTGIKHAQSDNITFDRVRGQYNNSHRYNWSPVSGALKGVASRGILVKDCDFSYNYTKGVWWDVSNYDATVVNTALNYNEENGAVFEIGAKGLLANCTIIGSGTHGILVLDNHAVRVWNCTIANSGRLKGLVFDAKSPRHLKVYSDNRRTVDSPPGGPGTGTYPGYGRDPRQPVGDPTMNNWLIQSFEMKNCILAPGVSQLQFAYLPVEDLQKSQSQSRNWTDYGISANGNLYNRLAANNPAWAFLLPGAGTAQTILQGSGALASWRTTTSQDAASIEVVGPSVLDADGWLTSANAALYAKDGTQCPAVPLPADIAALIGKPAGDRHVGAYPN